VREGQGIPSRLTDGPCGVAIAVLWTDLKTDPARVLVAAVRTVPRGDGCGLMPRTLGPQRRRSIDSDEGTINVADR
jgi:hypothetical protein